MISRLFLGLVLSGSQWAYASSPDNVQATIESVINANRASSSLHAWMDTGQTPQQALTAIREGSDAEKSAACTTLRQQTDANLTLFENELDPQKNAFLRNCVQELKDRINAYYRKDREHFAAFVGKPVPVPPDQFSTDSVPNTPTSCDPSLTRQLEIDPTNGPAFGAYQRHPGIPNLADHEIVFTFDDGPHPTRTPRALEILRQHCIQATFFTVGFMAKASPQILQDEYQAGHTIATHTWSHEYFPQLTQDRAIWQIEQGIAAATDILAGIASLVNPQVPATPAPFFRFPGGEETPATLSYMKTHNLASFTWDAGADDWTAISSDEAYRRGLQQVEMVKKGIFLVHDTQEKTVTMLSALLDELLRRGYKPVQLVPKATVVQQTP